MKNIIIAFIMILVSVITNKNYAQETKKTIPVVNIQDLKGKTISTASFKNDDKPMIIVFWTTVHKYPGKELDAINENYEDWKTETGVKVIAVSVDDSRTANRVGPLISGKGWGFDVYIDINSEFKRQMNVNLLPHTFIINGAGKIVWNKVGYNEGDETLMEAELKKIKN